MTAKITKDNTDDAASDAAAEASAESPVEEVADAGKGADGAGKAAPGKRKRRVRVIEVIEDDDEDIEDVIARIDAEDEAEPADEEPAAEEPAAKPKVAALPKKAKPAEPAEPAPAEPEADEPARPGALGTPGLIAVAVVVVVLAALAVWQWRVAAGKASEADDRADVAKVASAFGDVAANYSASNYQEQIAKAEKLMGGDLLERYKSQTAPGLVNTFKSGQSTASLASKSVAVFVGDVNGKLATAVVQVDITATTEQGPTQARANLIRLALAKIDGKWKVTKQYVSGQDDQTQPQDQTGAATLPTPSTSPSAKKKD
ncbi:hypothetical protein [Actinomadura atramentaria]|uniref:hypothetical protein n=1 Tax=Actinomadura atramentaria TaxID=1990 RepID=UPI0003803CE4|nr:hypothetical protein [Actinomadura atramentaria]